MFVFCCRDWSDLDGMMYFRLAFELSTASKSLRQEGFRAMVTGESMSPSIPAGTWVWIRPLGLGKDRGRKASEFRLGDVVIFPIDDREGFVCHRVIRSNCQWVWQASDHYGTYSRIPRNCVVGKVYAWERNGEEKHVLGTLDRLAGLIRCYGSIIIRHFLERFIRQIVGQVHLNRLSALLHRTH